MAQKIKNQFFTLHNAIRGDSVYNTLDKQVELVKKIGYVAIEINQVANFETTKAAIDKYKFKGAYFYIKVKLEESHFEQNLKECISQLKGTKTIIAPFIVSESKRFLPSTHEADSLAVLLLKQIGNWAEAANLQVAIYPHYGFYIERTDHALALVKKINQKNVGLTFNLCHWLATTKSEERETLKIHLKELYPYLKMITISGANDVITQKKVIWDDYILPLGQGSFDTLGMLKYLIEELKYKNSIGVQCYNIKGNKYELLKSNFTFWRDFKKE